MATKQNTSSKSLKAKALRKRAAPKRKRPAEDPILAIATRERKLWKAIESVRADRKKDQDDVWLREVEHNLHEALQFGLDQASFMTPRSPAGAGFLLVHLYSATRNMREQGSDHERGVLFARIERMAYGLQRYLRKQQGVNFYLLGENFMRIGADPEVRVADRID